MSISLVLVPLVVSAVAAAHTAAGTGKDSHGRVVCHVGTRMRDTDLLAGARLELTNDEVADLDRVSSWTPTAH